MTDERERLREALLSLDLDTDRDRELVRLTAEAVLAHDRPSVPERDTVLDGLWLHRCCENGYLGLPHNCLKGNDEVAALSGSSDPAQGAHIDRDRWESNADYRDGWNDGHRDGLQTAAALSGSSDPEADR